MHQKSNVVQSYSLTIQLLIYDNFSLEDDMIPIQNSVED